MRNHLLVDAVKQLRRRIEAARKVKSFGISRYVLSSCVAAAMLAGCGAQPPIGTLATPAKPQSATAPLSRSRAEGRAAGAIGVGLRNCEAERSVSAIRSRVKESTQIRIRKQNSAYARGIPGWCRIVCRPD
jgi:hypothetical protein